MTKHLTILLIIIFAAAGLRAQTKVYPIQVTISGSSDISPELSELYGIKSTLMFTFQCLDRKETNLPVAVKVRLYPASAYGKAIENTLQTGRKTFDIGFGQTIIEQKGDLEKYFLNEYTNLSQAGYYQNGQLAEGNYILQVVCYDARTISRQISNVAKIYLHIDQFNYPTLLFPRNNTDLEQYTTKPTISFQWTYYGKTDTKIRYRFELWEVINPTTVETYVKQNNPIFTEEDLFVTQKSYMPELLNLKIGQKYCWRVTAYDPDGKLPFKRGGESDVYQFQYLNPPVPVTGLANKVTGKQIKYTWNADRNHTKYYVEYYDYKRDTTISSSQQDNTVTLTAPEYDYRIKFRVRAECYNDPARVSEYTPWSEAYVQPEKKIDFECGKQFPDREIANQELKTTFFEGEIVESKNGDSRYEIIKATARPDGSLDGKFYAIMDCWSGAKILCDFWDTKINTDNIILTTRYRSEDIPGFVADPEEIKKYVHELVNNAHMAATDNKIRDTILINQKFDYLYAENGRLMAVVVDKNGEPQVTDVTPDKPYSQSLITDGKGDTLVVSKKGQVMGVKEYKFAGDDRHLLNEYHRQLDSLGEWQINFTPDTKHQTYAFDQIGSGNHGIFATDQYYPKSGSYDFRYKSVECGKSDKVIVEFGAYPQADSVIFKDKYGVKLKVVDGNILTFTGVNQADTNFIYAYRGDKKIGKLFLNTYQKKTYNVVLVSVNEAKILHEKNVDKAVKKVEESLNKVYNQCAVSFKITHAAIFIDDLTSFSHGGSGILTVYNDDQKRVLQAYDKEMKDGVFYLFFIDNVTDKKDGSGTPVSGYMPRGYNAGFIYDGGSPHTIAHELGHGIAGLEHVFENSNASGKTANLMDYATGEQLWHFQWDQIQDPSRVWMKWNKDEEEGEMVNGVPITEWVLIIYSPWVSGEFKQAYNDNDYYGMRKWTYKSLNQQFEGKHLGFYSKQVLKYEDNPNAKDENDIFANVDNKVAKLVHNPGKKKGVTVILSEYNAEDRIVFNKTPLYFPPYEGNFFVKLGLAYANLLELETNVMTYSDLYCPPCKLTSLFMGAFKPNSLSSLTLFPSTQDKIRKYGLEGLFYPVDIFLYDDKTQKCDGNSHYGPFDFIGLQVAGSAIAGYNDKNSSWDDILKLFNLNFGEAYTITIGRMRGYGVCAYGAAVQQSFGLDIGGAVAFVGAIYNGGKDENYWDKDYSPYKFAGKAVNASGGYIFVSVDFLKAFTIDEDGEEYNNYSGVEVELTVGPFPASFTIFSEQSELIDLSNYLK